MEKCRHSKKNYEDKLKTSSCMRFRCPSGQLSMKSKIPFGSLQLLEHIYILNSHSVIFVHFSPGLLLQQHGLVLCHHGLLGQELGALLAPLQRLLGHPGVLLVSADPLLQRALLVLRLLPQLLLARQLAPLYLTPQLFLLGLTNEVRVLTELTNERQALT